MTTRRTTGVFDNKGGDNASSPPKGVHVMDDKAERTTPGLLLDLMFEALRVKDERLNGIVNELFGRFGDKPTRQLVLEAASRKNKPAHRLCTLRAIARTGQLDDPKVFMDIFLLLRDLDFEIRQEAAKLISSSSSRAQGGTLGLNAY